MNYNRQVLVFTITFSLFLLCYSFYSIFAKNDFLHLGKVNLLSAVLIEEKTEPVPEPALLDTAQANTGEVASSSTTPERPVGVRNKNVYTLPHRLLHASADTTRVGLPHFMGKLKELKKGKRRKLRIAWMGDSIIEADLLTQTFRKLMQQQFGEYGVGFVSMKSISADNRTTVKAKSTGSWKEENLRSKTDVRVYLSGFSFYTNDGEVTMQDATVADKSQVLVKTLICGNAGGHVNVRVNGVNRSVVAPKHFNHVVLDSSVEQRIMVGIESEQLPVYGVSFEPVEGVVLDNYSFRGITGIELKKLDTACLREIDEEQYYDLVILEYGVNVLWKADDKSYPYYRQQMKKVLPILRKAMPHTEFLIISTADRAFMYDEAARTALGIDSLIKTQADLAFENGMAFYNMYESMGGYGTIVKWADMEQPLARKDYIHPNHQGAERLGKMLYNDFMNDYSRFENQKH